MGLEVLFLILHLGCDPKYGVYEGVLTNAGCKLQCSETACYTIVMREFVYSAFLFL